LFDLTYKQRPYTFLLPRKCHSSGGKFFLRLSLQGQGGGAWVLALLRNLPITLECGCNTPKRTDLCSDPVYNKEDNNRSEKFVQVLCIIALLLPSAKIGSSHGLALGDLK
jgi:hypothetical protein